MNHRIKPNWAQASEDQKLEFNDHIFRHFINLHIPDSILNCSDVNCKDKKHIEDIDNYLMTMLNSIMESGYDTIPQIIPKNNKKNKHKKNTPGWKEFVEPFQDKAHFWHSIRKSAGKPLNTELHKIMKMTRNK